MKRILFILLMLLLVSPICFSWDGYDYEDGEYVEIGEGNLVRSGTEIEVYHYGSGEYRYEEVESVSSDTVETYDYETGEYNSYDMD